MKIITLLILDRFYQRVWSITLYPMLNNKQSIAQFNIKFVHLILPTPPIPIIKITMVSFLNIVVTSLPSEIGVSKAQIVTATFFKPRTEISPDRQLIALILDPIDWVGFKLPQREGMKSSTSLMQICLSSALLTTTWIFNNTFSNRLSKSKETNLSNNISMAPLESREP